ncbi:hypothetical protein V9T40_000605 [Parthenolecanium corni]|uniref:Uncharacterized protein n=1 Tax=Parthenolecanium corni TaxID=536013 RepID=A0AAN9TQR7_9HEMI
MSGTDEFDIDAAYHQIESCYLSIRLKRCDAADHSPPSKKLKLYDDNLTADYQCTLSGSNNIKLVRKEKVSISIDAANSSLSEEDEFTELEPTAAKKQTSRKSTYRPCTETDRRKKETLERVKPKLKYLSPIRKKMPPKYNKLNKLFEICNRNKKNIGRLSMEGSTSSSNVEDSSNDERFDVKPHFEVPSFEAVTSSVASISSPSTVPDDIEIEEESKVDLYRISNSCDADMPLIDKPEKDGTILSSVKMEKLQEVTLPVTITSSARPSICVDESEIKTVLSEKRDPKIDTFPFFGPSISVSLVRPDNELLKNAETIEPPKSKVGLIKVRSLHELGIASVSESFEKGLSNLYYDPPQIIVLSTPQPSVANTRVSNQPSKTSQISTHPAVASCVSSQLSRTAPISTHPAVASRVSDQPNKTTPISTHPAVASRVSDQPNKTTPMSTHPAVASHVSTKPGVTDVPRDPRLTNKSSTQVTSLSVPQLAATQSTVAQTSSASRVSKNISLSKSRNISKTSAPELKNRQISSKDMKKICELLKDLHKEYLKKNISKKRKGEMEDREFEILRGYLRSALRQGPSDNDEFLNYVMVNLIAILDNTFQSEILKIGDTNFLITLLGHESMEPLFTMSTLLDAISKRAKRIESKQHQPDTTASLPLREVVNNQSRPPPVRHQPKIGADMPVSSPIRGVVQNQSKPSPPPYFSAAAAPQTRPSPQTSSSVLQTPSSTYSPSTAVQNRYTSQRIPVNTNPLHPCQLSSQIAESEVAQNRLSYQVAPVTSGIIDIPNLLNSTIQSPNGSTVQLTRETCSINTVTQNIGYVCNYNNQPAYSVPINPVPQQQYIQQQLPLYQEHLQQQPLYQQNVQLQHQQSLQYQQPQYHQIQQQHQVQYLQPQYYHQQQQQQLQYQQPLRQEHHQILGQQVQLPSPLPQQFQPQIQSPGTNFFAQTTAVPSIQPVSVPLINSSQSPSPRQNTPDSIGRTPVNEQPESVNVVHSTSRTTPERIQEISKDDHVSVFILFSF